MTVRVRCPNSQCGYEADVSEKVLGKSARCKTCGTTFVLRAVEETKDGAAEVSLSMLNGDAAPPQLPALTQPGSLPIAPPPLEQAVTPGTLIGRFEVRERIGSGAFGTVYLAFDPQLQREVALKVPRQSVLNNPRRVERFLREARAAAKLRHPNIVPVYDAGQAGDQFYIASAFVRGEPLSDLIDDGGIDAKQAAKIVRALGEALAYAHREGVVHRDVKLANVMVDDEGQPLLMDFGLAAQVESMDDFQLPEQEADERSSRHDDSRLTREGSVMGTPSYMAPEIARGQRGEAQPAADQYALGVVLYELLTGRTPFEGPPAAVLHQVIHESPPKPSEFRKDLPADLEAICLKAMARRPGDRYVTCAATADDLRRWLDGEPVRARKQGFVARTKRSMRENPTFALGGAGVIAAALAVIAFLAVQWSSALAEGDTAASQARAERDRAADAEAQRKAEQDRAARATQQQKADADFTLAQEKLDAGNASAAWDLVNGIPLEFRHPGWAFLMARIEGFPEFRSVLPSQPTVALDFDSQSRFILQVASNGDLVVRDVWTDREVRRLPLHLKGEEFYWHSAAMSADGKRIATFASPMNHPGFGGQGPQIVMAAPPPPPKGAKVEPRKPQVVVWDEQGKQIRTIAAAEAPFRLALSRDGTLLAIAGGPRDGAQKLTLWNVDSGGRIAVMDKTLAELAGPAFAMAFSWDGSLFAATTIHDGGEIRVWNTATGEERLVIKDKTAVITHLAFSPDGTRLAAAGGGDRLEGPTRKVKVQECAPYEVDVTVERDGKKVSEKQTAMRCVEKEVEVRGFFCPRMKNVVKPVCEVHKRTRTVYKQVMKTETYTVYEEVQEKVKRDGKEETVTRKVPVTKQRNICIAVPVQEEYEVVNTKSVVTQVMDIEPLVRVWKIDGAALETTITETGPVTALAWRADGAVLATATNLDNACDGASPCDCGGFYGGYYGGSYGGYAMPAPAPAPGAPKIDEPVSDARKMSQLLAALLGTCFGHYGGVGPNCDADRAKVSLWDPATGKLLIALPTPSWPVAAIAFSPDNRHIAAGSSGFAGITLWTVSSRWLLVSGRGDGAITDLLYSQDGNRLASFTQCDNTVRLWDGAAGSLVTRLEGTGPFMQFLPERRFLAHRQEGTMFDCGAGSAAGPLGRWLSQDGSEEKHPGGRVGVQAYSADGKRFVAGETMPMPRLVVYDGQSGAEICTLAESAGTMGLRKVQISKDGSRVAAVTWAEAILWDGNTGKLLARRMEISEADLSPDGKRWAVATRPMFAPPPTMMEPIPVPKNKDDSDEPPDAPLPPKSKKTATAGPGEFLFPPLLPKTKPEPEPGPKKALPAPEPIQGGPAQFTPKPPTLTLFDGDGKETAKLPGAEFHYDSLTFDPTSKTLIAVANGEIVRIYKAETGKLTAQFRTSDPKVAVSPDGKYLAIHRPQPLFPTVSAAPPKMAPMPKALPPKVGSIVPEPGKSELISQIPDPETKKSPAPAPAIVPPAPAIPFPGPPAGTDSDVEPPFSQHEDSPGGRRTMFVTVIDLSNGQPIWNASVIGTGHGGMAFSADAKRLALGYVDGNAGNVQVWDAAAPEGGDKWKHEIVARYSGHHGAVNAVAFSPDGTRLASGGADRVVKVWKLPAEGEAGPGADVPGIGGPAVASAK